MNWVDRPKNNIIRVCMEFCNFCKVPHLDNFPQKTLKLGRVAFHSLAFQFLCLDFQSNQYKKLAPVPSHFCTGLYTVVV